MTNHLNDDLEKAQIALDEAKAHEQEAIVNCQRTMTVFKFKKYKRGTKTGSVERF